MNLKCGIYKSMKINLQMEIHLLFQICACSENNEFPVMLKKTNVKVTINIEYSHPVKSLSKWRIFLSTPNIIGTNNLGFKDTIKVKCSVVNVLVLINVWGFRKRKLLRISSHILFLDTDCCVLEAVSVLQDLMPWSYLPQR